jgi:hypothetical protein
MKELKIVVDDQVHRRLKMAAASAGKSMKHYVTKLIVEDYTKLVEGDHELAIGKMIDEGNEEFERRASQTDKAILSRIEREEGEMFKAHPEWAEEESREWNALLEAEKKDREKQVDDHSERLSKVRTRKKTRSKKTGKNQK